MVQSFKILLNYGTRHESLKFLRFGVKSSYTNDSNPLKSQKCYGMWYKISIQIFSCWANYSELLLKSLRDDGLDKLLSKKVITNNLALSWIMVNKVLLLFFLLHDDQNCWRTISKLVLLLNIKIAGGRFKIVLLSNIKYYWILKFPEDDFVAGCQIKLWRTMLLLNHNCFWRTILLLDTR